MCKINYDRSCLGDSNLNIVRANVWMSVQRSIVVVTLVVDLIVDGWTKLKFLSMRQLRCSTTIVGNEIRLGSTGLNPLVVHTPQGGKLDVGRTTHMRVWGARVDHLEKERELEIMMILVRVSFSTKPTTPCLSTWSTRHAATVQQRIEVGRVTCAMLYAIALSQVENDTKIAFKSTDN